MVCQICLVEYANMRALNNHLRGTHNISSKIYYDKYIKSASDGICKCCGKKTTFISIERGYRDFCSSACCGRIKIGKPRTYTVSTKKEDKKELNIMCPLCQFKTFSYQSLITHVQHHHPEYVSKKDKISKQIFDSFFKQDGDGICKQCGKPTRFYALPKGYSDFCSISCKRINELVNGDYKVRNNAFKWKEFTFPSGRTIKTQGLENQCLSYLLEAGVREDNIVTSGKQMPVIEYVIAGRKHKYFPDIFILDKNLVIEVKGNFTYYQYLELNTIKKQAAIDSGYNFAFSIENDYTEIKKYI